MIKTPHARRRLIPKTASGYKLRGAMVWVAAGVVAGIAAALAAFALTLGIAYAMTALLDSVREICPDRPFWLHALLLLEAFAVFAAIAWLLLVARGAVIARSQARYGEFARDVGDWFGFGAMLAFIVSGLPLWVIAVFADSC